MSLKGLRFTLSIDGQEETALAVVDFTLYQQYSRPFVMEVHVASTLFGLTAPDFLEKNTVLTLWQGNTPQRYISGIVTTVARANNDGWQMHYHLTLAPRLWRCGLRQNFRIFQQQDIQAISSTLLTENGITDWTPWFYDNHSPREFCVQYGESDPAFLTRLWAEEGIFFFDKHAPDGPEQTLTLCYEVDAESAGNRRTESVGHRRAESDRNRRHCTCAVGWCGLSDHRGRGDEYLRGAGAILTGWHAEIPAGR